MKCEVCGKPMNLNGLNIEIKGTPPKVFHWQCAYDACKPSRDRLEQLKQASQARRGIVSGSLDKQEK